MQTACLKDQRLVFHNPIASSIPFVPWWRTVGSPPAYSEPLSQLKATADQTGIGELLPVAARQASTVAIPYIEDPTTKFSISHELSKEPPKVPKTQIPSSISVQASLPNHKAHVEIGLGPLVSANYPCIDPSYGLCALYGGQGMHGRMLLPLNVADGPIYVNAKQYHGILRRRQSRAKAESGNKVVKVRKPYLHKSRHLHAMRRARGSGGRFLNTKNVDGAKEGVSSDQRKNGHLTEPVSSLSSEVLQCNSGHVNSGKETSSGSSVSGSEVTSVYSQESGYPIGHLGPAFRSLPILMDGDRVMRNNWAPAAGGCCEFLKVG